MNRGVSLPLMVQRDIKKHSTRRVFQRICFDNILKNRVDCSGLISEREGSISPVCFQGWLPNYWSHVFCPVCLANGWVFVYLAPLKQMVPGCEPSLIGQTWHTLVGIPYYELCMLLWVMATGCSYFPVSYQIYHRLRGTIEYWCYLYL